MTLIANAAKFPILHIQMPLGIFDKSMIDQLGKLQIQNVEVTIWTSQDCRPLHRTCPSHHFLSEVLP